MVRKVDGLSDIAARRSFVDSGTTLAWLVEHLSYAEDLWVVQRFAGRATSLTPLPEPVGLERSVEIYRSTWATVDAIVEASSLDDLCTADVADPAVNLRWVLMHLLEETARHAGHADILRELIDGSTGR